MNEFFEVSKLVDLDLGLGGVTAMFFDVGSGVCGDFVTDFGEEEDGVGIMWDFGFGKGLFSSGREGVDAGSR